MLGSLPPGPRCLVQHAHYIAGPPLATYIAIYLLERVGLAPARWIVVTACMLSYIFLYTAVSAWSEFQMNRAAARFGAKVPVQARKTGIKMATNFENAYPRE